jgi:hypothetical protein
LNNVVAQNYAGFFAIREVFGEPQRVGDAALALLIGVIEMRQAELLTVGQQAQKIARITTAGDQQNVPEFPRRPGFESGNRSWACHRSATNVCW